MMAEIGAVMGKEAVFRKEAWAAQTREALAVRMVGCNL
ncbi:hypothetical protein GMO_10090 [Gluconobacter morbifer G707]|uniref:Uncharacterized protein n=1 Tax=Gluconobacter morbifer G707 TaxID=1088869 RepID=G6XHP3_9PROT|nr:hypothetical protein GMO_10090 [Gluconobacter morbifer G707]